MIIHDLSIHIVPYLIKPYDQTITIINFPGSAFIEQILSFQMILRLAWLAQYFF